MNANRKSKKHSPPRAGAKPGKWANAPSTATATAARVKSVQYSCDPQCKAIPKKRKLKAGDIVLLIADDTDVTIDFIAGSPFVSGSTHISIAANTVDTEIVAPASSANQSFKYTLTCSECSSPTTNPEMIVE
jgi:hypothetical protein